MASRAILSFMSDDQGLSPHYRVRLPARVSTTTGEMAVTIREIWVGGAVLEGDRLPATGKDVILHRGTDEVFGGITMSGAESCVIQFEDAIDEGQLLLWLYAPGEPVQPMLRPHFNHSDPRNEEGEAEEWNLNRSQGYQQGKGAFGN